VREPFAAAWREFTVERRDAHLKRGLFSAMHKPAWNRLGASETERHDHCCIVS